MKTEQILIMDATHSNESKIIIQKVLRQIKPLSKFSDDKQIPIEALEKTITVLTSKYAIQPQWISCTYSGEIAGEYGHYSCGVKTSDTHKWLGTVMAHSVYELFAKLVIFMYSEVKSGKIELRQEKEEIKTDDTEGEWDEN